MREAIESVLIQNYGNMEIVVADDASTDGSQDLLRKYEQQHPGLFKLIFNQTNLGLVPNNNVVLGNCTGKYVAWLDGDDLFLPGKIKKQVDLLESQPGCVICHHLVEVFESDTGTVLNNFVDKTLPKEGSIDILFDRFYLVPCSVMTLRSACPEEGYNTLFSRHADPLFWFETAVNGRIGYIPEVLARYRRHEGNVTQDISNLDWKIARFFTFATLGAKHPHLARQSRKASGWAQHLYRAAVGKVLEGQGKTGRELLFESLRQGWVSWKWFGWYMRSFISIQ